MHTVCMQIFLLCTLSLACADIHTCTQTQYTQAASTTLPDDGGNDLLGRQMGETFVHAHSMPLSVRMDENKVRVFTNNRSWQED